MEDSGWLGLKIETFSIVMDRRLSKSIVKLSLRQSRVVSTDESSQRTSHLNERAVSLSTDEFPPRPVVPTDNLSDYHLYSQCRISFLEVDAPYP